MGTGQLSNLNNYLDAYRECAIKRNARTCTPASVPVHRHTRTGFSIAYTGIYIPYMGLSIAGVREGLFPTEDYLCKMTFSSRTE